MKDALIVLNPRMIQETMQAFEELDIPKIYLRGWSEGRIEDKGWEYAMTYGYEWYWVASDDIIVRPHNLTALRYFASHRDKSSSVYTGYSQRSHTDWTVNLCPTPLTGDLPQPDAYNFLTYSDVVAGPRTITSFFTGMSMTGMSAFAWQRFPFKCFRDNPDDPGYGSDFHLSKRLQDAEWEIIAVREAFTYHWRHNWVNTTDPRDADPNIGEERIVVSL